MNKLKQDQQISPAKPSPNYKTFVIILTSRNDYKKYLGVPQLCNSGPTQYILGKYKILNTYELSYYTSKTKKNFQGSSRKSESRRMPVKMVE